MQNTSYYNLKKPELEDIANIEDLNDNADTLDATLKSHADAIGDRIEKTGDASDAKVESSTASPASYPIPAAGDTLKVILGKIIKFFTDIKAAITGLSVSGQTITYTKADGSSGTITTQDTTYSNASNAADGLMSSSAFRQLFNRVSASDASYNADNVGKVWKCNSSGQPVWGTDNNTTYTAGTGLSLSSGKFNHSNSITAGTAGQSTASNAQNTVAVPYVTYDAQGHVTASGTHTHTINAMEAATASAAGKTGLVPQPAKGKQAQFLRGDATWATPTDTTYTAGTGLTLSGTQFKHSNAVTAGTAGQSSASSGRNTLAVPYVTYDAQGHVTAAGTHTHTISNFSGATSDAAGAVGLVPQPAAGRNTYYLRGDATWQAPQNNLTTTAAGLVLDARQGKTLNDKINNIKIITPIAGTYDNLANNTVKGVASLSLPAGTYLVIGNASVNVAATTGNLAGTVNTSASLGASPMVQAFNGTGASITCMWCYTLSATTNVYMVVRQTSGSAKDILYNLAAIRLS